MSQVIGEKIPKLVEQLEIYSTGLEIKGDLSGGGPLIATLDHEGGVSDFVLCWVRGVPHARPNSWEAWGLVATDIKDIKTWPSHWGAMKREPSSESLENFVERLERGWGDSMPPRPDRLPLLLSRIHRKNVSERPATHFKVPIFQEEDIGILAWLWLLGPIPWNTASVVPPHKNAVILKTDPSYEGLIVDAPQPETNTEVSPFINDLFSLVDRGDTRSLEERIREFRRQSLEARRRTLDPVSTSPFGWGTVKPSPRPQAPEDKKRKWINFRPAKLSASKEGGKTAGKKERMPASPLPLMPQERHLITIESKVNLILAAAITLLVMNALGRVEKTAVSQRNEPPKAVDPIAASNTSVSHTQVAEENKIVFDHATLDRMHRSLIGRLSLAASPRLQNLDLSKIEDPELRKRLAQAATQIRLSEEHCEPMVMLIDGDIGENTRKRIIECDNTNVNSSLESEDAALKWLYTWLGLSPTR